MVLQAIKYTPAPPSGEAPILDILDQLALPHQTTYLPITSCEDAHDAIKTMKVRGAPAIAIVAALSLCVEIGGMKNGMNLSDDPKSVEKNIGEKLDHLMTSRPTAVNLGDAVRKLKEVTKKSAHAVCKSNGHGPEIAFKVIAAAEQMLVDDVADNKAIGKHGAKWIEENTAAGERRATDKKTKLKVLTHCNTGSLATAGYGTAMGVIRSLREEGILTEAYCTETRPYNQGSRLTAYELVHDKIPATLITDSMAASLMAREGDSLAAIVVGADRVAANGDTANKVGTYSLAVLARHHGIKFLVAAPKTTIDLHTASGEDIVIEERAPEEVTRIKGPVVAKGGELLVDDEPQTVSTAAIGINVWNPAFDVTPADLIDGVITEVGVIEKNAKGAFDFGPIFGKEGGKSS